jgi:hypothetical protein
VSGSAGDAWGACQGGWISAESCNGIDDDCDGAIDEDCAACIHVAPNGDDAAALANENMTPFATVQAAIDFANGRRDIATGVCVAAGTTCGATATFTGPSSGDLTMRDRIDVFGGYEATTFTRCTNSTTHLAPQTGKGVLFPSNIGSPTTLDGSRSTAMRREPARPASRSTAHAMSCCRT